MPFRKFRMRGPRRRSTDRNETQRRRFALVERLESRQLLAGDIAFVDALPNAEEARFGNAILNQEGRSVCLAFVADSTAEGELPLSGPAAAPGDVDVSAAIVQPTGPLAPGAAFESTITFENAGPSTAAATDLDVTFDSALTGVTWERELFRAQATTVAVADLDGTDGFRVQGNNALMLSGLSVSGVGDVNNDTFDDFAVTYQGDPLGTGADASDGVYVIYGAASGIPAEFDFGSITSTEGVRITEVSSDGSVMRVDAAGDVNDDGFDDVIIGATGDVATSAGTAYVIFGSASLPGEVDASALDGTNGFSVSGLNVGDSLGSSVSGAGDVNNDGVADVIIGAQNVTQTTPDPDQADAGEAYVIFGKSSGNAFAATIDLSAPNSTNGTNGLAIRPEAEGDQLGAAVDNLGDVNGDLIDDFLVTATQGGTNGSALGSAYVLYGKSSFTSAINLGSLAGADGFEIAGIRAGQLLGLEASGLGDINGDGLGDLLLAEGPDEGLALGGARAYAVFGFNNTSGTFDLGTLDGTNGFTLVPTDTATGSPLTVSEAGDVNGDGLGDLLLGTTEDLAGETTLPGRGFVVYGSESAFPTSLSLSSLDGTDGFTIVGMNTEELAGGAVASAGDINGDGLSDLMVAAPFGNPGSPENILAGETYVVYGVGSTFTDGVGNVDQTEDLAPGDRVIYHVDALIANDATGSTTVNALVANPDDNTAGNNSAAAVTTIQAAPTVESIQINDGGASRSQITSVTVTFDQIVDHAPLDTAFQVTQIDSDTQVGTLVIGTTDIGGKTVATITFSGASTVARSGSGALDDSLADGNYRLDIDATKVVASGVPMASNVVFGGQVKADTPNDDFFRLFGDANGDGSRNGIDLNLIIPSLFSIPNYRSDLDSNGDGAINGIDLNALIPTIFGAPRS